jgi:hypothetical protein
MTWEIRYIEGSDRNSTCKVPSQPVSRPRLKTRIPQIQNRGAYHCIIGNNRMSAGKQTEYHDVVTVLLPYTSSLAMIISVIPHCMTYITD